MTKSGENQKGLLPEPKQIRHRRLKLPRLDDLTPDQKRTSVGRSSDSRIKAMDAPSQKQNVFSGQCIQLTVYGCGHSCGVENKFRTTFPVVMLSCKHKKTNRHEIAMVSALFGQVLG